MSIVSELYFRFFEMVRKKFVKIKKKYFLIYNKSTGKVWKAIFDKKKYISGFETFNLFETV